MAKVAVVHLNARASSSLDWNVERKEALALLAAGKQILWALDFGPFSELLKPLSNGGQFLNLGLAIDHFREQLWKEFRRFSLGVSLYTVSCDFLNGFLWDEEQERNLHLWLKEHFETAAELSAESESLFQAFEDVTRQKLAATRQGKILLHLFARDVSADYLEQLAGRVPDEIRPYIIFDKCSEDLMLEMLLGNPERYGRLEIYRPKPFLNWRTEERVEKGICLPPVDLVKPSLLFPFERSLTGLRKEPTKLIPEEVLTLAWDGLNELFYSPKALSLQGKRKLQGFLAAGGNAIPLEE